MRRHDEALAIAILDDHPMVRSGIERELREAFPAAGIAYSGEVVREAVRALAGHSHPLAVVDLDLGTGVSVGEVVSAFLPAAIPVVVVSANGSSEAVAAALDAGARSFVTKRTGATELVYAIERVLDGETWISPDLAGVLLRGSPVVELSDQQRRALVLYASGLTMDMVARRMGISANTAKDYIDRVRSKYRSAGYAADTKMDLHAVARREGYLE